MQMTEVAAHPHWQWVVGSLLGIVGVIGLVAVLSPRTFYRLASWSNIWVDTDKLLRVFDVRVDIEHYVLRHSRLFGIVIVGAALTLAGCLVRLPFAPHGAVWAGLGVVAATGLLAVVSPRMFTRLAGWCSIWIDVDQFARKFDRRIEVDPHVLRHSRRFGMLIVAAAIAAASFMLWAA
jgi:hypothetical protein